MRDLSFLLLLKNSLAAKMKRGIRNICNGVTSTSPLKHHKKPSTSTTVPSVVGSNMKEEAQTTTFDKDDDEEDHDNGDHLTLEEMILQLDLEEEAARRRAARLDRGYYCEPQQPRRMSCVNNSDILRSARSALSQYPRFSLDGRDAICRPSFGAVGSGSYEGGVQRQRRSSCERGHRVATTGDQGVVWCKPGVVPKLMGLDVVPIPVKDGHRHHGKRKQQRVVHRPEGTSGGRRESLRRMARHELERERVVMMGMRGGCNVDVGSSWSASTDCCGMMKPEVSVEQPFGGGPAA